MKELTRLSGLPWLHQLKPKLRTPRSREPREEPEEGLEGPGGLRRARGSPRRGWDGGDMAIRFGMAILASLIQKRPGRAILSPFNSEAT